MIKNKKSSSIIKIFIGLFFLTSVIYPLFKMLLYIGQVDLGKLLGSDQFLSALKNSLLTSITYQQYHFYQIRETDPYPY